MLGSFENRCIKQEVKMSQTFDIQGKTALVTGANRGIGKSIVETFIKHGAKKVYAAVRNTDSASFLVKEFGEKVEPIQLDLSQPDTIREAAKKAKDADIVVNNAGILRSANPLDDHAIEALKEELEVNLFGLVHIARAFAPVLKANGGGAFIQLNSVVSMKSFPEVATYSASKAASYSITQALRELLAKQGTFVLSVHPGPIDTDMASKAGLSDVAEPAEVVAEGIVTALKQGDFHLFPDQMASEMGRAYRPFAEEVVE